MAGQSGDPAPRRAGEPIGGETARAPGIHPGDDRSSVVGAGATPVVPGYPAPGDRVGGAGGQE